MDNESVAGALSDPWKGRFIAAPSDQLRVQRIERLHSKFLNASAEHPALMHVACQSDQERLWVAMSPAWAHPINSDVHEKVHKAFWRDATNYGRYERRLMGSFVSPAHFVTIGQHTWSGRYADPDCEDSREASLGEVSHPGIELFEELSQEAIDAFRAPSRPPLRVCESTDELPESRNWWLSGLYEVFQHEPEQVDYHPNFPFAMNPGESFSVVGLPSNVFLSSARTIESVMEGRTLGSLAVSDPWDRGSSAHDEGPGSMKEHQEQSGERTADSNTDTRENVPPRIPESTDVRDLCQLLQKHLPKGQKQIEIAREFTGEMPGKDPKAKSLLRQARRYRNLWAEADS